MAHPQQVQFCKMVRKKFPTHFSRVNVVDCGSLDINGNNRYLFKWSNYIGVDIVDGPNVDVVGRIHKVLPGLTAKTNFNAMYPDKPFNPQRFNTIISTEMLEHDEYWEESLRAMYYKLLPGGLLLITAAGNGRREHGTATMDPSSSPGTHNYYRNITNGMMDEVLDPSLFTEYFMKQDPSNCDFQFYGIKG